MDIDLDFADRDDILRLIPHTRAKMWHVDKEIPHPSGIYPTHIPKDAFTNLSIYRYEKAEELGYFKIDFLNNSLYRYVKSPEHLNQLLEQEPEWQRLEDNNFVRNIVHIGAYHDIIMRLPLPINCIDHMAMFIAMLRPAKKHLLGKRWDEVEKTIWNKEPSGLYGYKKAHAYAFAMSIVINMALVSSGVDVQSLDGDFNGFG